MWLLQVRSLEQSNKLLEAEIDAIKGHYVKPSGLRMLYEEQLRELRRIADQMKVQRVRDGGPQGDYALLTYTSTP